MRTLGRELDDARSALVLASPMDPASVEVCMDLLAGDDPAARNVLSVLFTRRPDRRLENWEQHVGGLPERFEILTTQEPSGRHDEVDVGTLSDPGNLTEVGISITDRLATWSDDRPGSLCLHSVTAQLQHANTDQVYQFLYTLCDHLAEEGVRGHVHLNPGAHDARTVDTLETLFDAVVEVDEEETTVSTR